MGNQATVDNAYHFYEPDGEGGMRRLILPVLTTLFVFASVGCDNRKAKAAKVQNDLNQLAAALVEYQADFHHFPASLNALSKPFTGRSGRIIGPYIVSVPVDSWGNPYVYHGPAADDAKVDLFSMGADGRQGGGDDVHQAVKSLN